MIQDKGVKMSNNVANSLKEIQQIDGFLAAAVAHAESGMALGMSGGGKTFDVEVAVAANSDVIKSKIKAMKALKIKGGIEDILITLDEQYHLIRPMKSNPVVFIYLALNRANSNLALARLKLQQIEASLVV